MIRMRCSLLAALLIIVALTGCSSAKSRALEPDEIVTQVLADCRAGAYEAVADRMKDGPSMWKKQPGLVRDFVDRLCTNGQAKSFQVHERVPQGEEGLALHLTTFTDSDHKEGLRTMTLVFARQGEQWILAKVD